VEDCLGVRGYSRGSETGRRISLQSRGFGRHLRTGEGESVQVAWSVVAAAAVVAVANFVDFVAYSVVASRASHCPWSRVDTTTAFGAARAPRPRCRPPVCSRSRRRVPSCRRWWRRDSESCSPSYKRTAGDGWSGGRCWSRRAAAPCAAAAAVAAGAGGAAAAGRGRGRRRRRATTSSRPRRRDAVPTWRSTIRGRERGALPPLQRSPFTTRSIALAPEPSSSVATLTTAPRKTKTKKLRTHARTPPTLEHQPIHETKKFRCARLDNRLMKSGNTEKNSEGRQYRRRMQRPHTQRSRFELRPAFALSPGPLRQPAGTDDRSGRRRRTPKGASAGSAATKLFWRHENDKIFKKSYVIRLEIRHHENYKSEKPITSIFSRL
jgi:hypothetical protein